MPYFQSDTRYESFPSEQHLLGYPRIHPSERRSRVHRCQFCGYSTSLSSRLRAHIMTHTGEKPYVCPHCHMTFARNYTLQCHLRRHTGEKPFVCEVCNTAFRFLGALRRHKMVHAVEKF